MSAHSASRATRTIRAETAGSSALALGPNQRGNPEGEVDFRPLALARILTQGAERELQEARAYTGVPSPDRDARGHGAMQRRLQAWKADAPEIVRVRERPLRYPPPRGREKGIDVQLAIDFVRKAIDNAYDAAILASADSDLVPALEFVAERFPEKVIETVAWQPLPDCEAAAPIDIRGGGVIRRQVSKQEFDRIADRRNFLIAQGTAPLPGQSGRRLPPGRGA